ncbi:MAG: aldehyde dehydrogenase [Ignavibacteria bacterium]|nr:aldehyde dehydrogenase [Ignavibacteria bacterium]
MAIRIGINGFGRIGKLVFRLASLSPNIKVVHINDKMPIELLAHLMKYDSIHGQFEHSIKHNKNYIYLNDQNILVSNNETPAEINWNNEVDIAVESSGKFKIKKELEGHFKSGVKKVILSCPSKDNSVDKTVVFGVNHLDLLPSDLIISNGSCTTNCVCVMLQVLKNQFGIKRCFMNTVHPFTNNQNLQDGFHKDFRRARSAFANIIPTSTSAVETTKIIFPELKDSFDGFATRVPVPDCSYVELSAELNCDVTVEDVNAAFLHYSQNDLKGCLEYSSVPLVSSDITNNCHSAIYDSLCTKVLLGNMIQIIAWYDNESGYSARIIDLINFLSKI